MIDEKKEKVGHSKLCKRFFYNKKDTKLNVIKTGEYSIYNWWKKIK